MGRVAGVGVLTISFFGVHSIASSWVGRRSGAHKAEAASPYLLVYYAEASLAGSLGGRFWSHARWPGVAGFTAALLAAALVVAARLASLRPLPENTAPLDGRSTAPMMMSDEPRLRMRTSGATPDAHPPLERSRARLTQPKR